MRPRDLSNLLRKAIKCRLPILIKGAPGAGKSDIVAQAAAAAGANVVLMHPVVSDPTDFKGLPGIVAGKAEFLPFGDLRQLVEADEPTVAFLDDLGQAPAVVQAAAMQLILARRVNGHKVSDKVVFVAATNRREDRAGVTGILEPVKSRFASIVELTPTLDDWCEWALEHDVPAEVIAFCRFRPELFAPKDPPTADIVNRPCPRTITQMGALYAAGITDLESLGGAVGQGFAVEFVAFLRTYQDLPSIDSILLNPTTAGVPRNPAALYAVTTALAINASVANVERIIKYLERLPREFQTLGVRDIDRRDKKMANNKAMIAWFAKNQDILVGGAR